MISVYSVNEDIVTVSKTGELYGANVGEGSVFVHYEGRRPVEYVVKVEYTTWQKFIRSWIILFQRFVRS